MLNLKHSRTELPSVCLNLDLAACTVLHWFMLDLDIILCTVLHWYKFRSRCMCMWHMFRTESRCKVMCSVLCTYKISSLHLTV